VDDFVAEDFPAPQAGVDKTASVEHGDAHSAKRQASQTARAGGGRRSTAHLYSAARTLEQILGELYPEHDWVVTVGEVERPDRQRDAAAPVALDEAGPVADHPGALVDRHPPAAADRNDDDGLDQAA
jgi:hypothetical protein